MTLPTDAEERKGIPLYRGLFRYFPDALCAVAELSRVANEQHNPGEPMHWARQKSKDQEDCLLRHMLGLGTVDTDGIRHAAKVAWRALAILQLEIEGGSASKEPDGGIFYYPQDDGGEGLLFRFIGSELIWQHGAPDESWNPDYTFSTDPDDPHGAGLSENYPQALAAAKEHFGLPK